MSKGVPQIVTASYDGLAVGYIKATTDITDGNDGGMLLTLQMGTGIKVTQHSDEAVTLCFEGSDEARGVIQMLGEIHDQLEPALKPPRFVLQDWVGAMTLRQQGVLILALRGPDGSMKESASKPLVRTLRALVMVSGREGTPMQWGTFWRNDTFMATTYITSDAGWDLVTKAFFAEMDACNLHFFQHLIHAFAVAGLGHPDLGVRRRCWMFYERACDKLHLRPENHHDLLHRLRDGEREEDGQ